MNNSHIRYNVIKFITLFLLTLLYQQIAPMIKIGGIVPNLSFVLMLSATMADSDAGIFFPLIFGMVYDFMNGVVFGMYVIIYVLITFTAGEIYHKNFENVTFIEILFMILGCFCYSFFSALFISFMDEGFWTLFLKTSLPEFLYNFIVGIIVFLIYKKIVSSSFSGIRRSSRRGSAWKI